MRQIDRLKKEAREASTRRGHVLGKFASSGIRTKLAEATCIHTGCIAWVCVNGRPGHGRCVELSGEDISR